MSFFGSFRLPSIMALLSTKGYPLGKSFSPENGQAWSP